MNTKFIRSLIIFLIIFFVFRVYASESVGTINSSNKYAWGENIGWVNFAPQNGNTYTGLTITDTSVTGYAWSNEFGWINFSPSNSGQGVLNTTSGNLSGQAWVASLGWLNMSGVSINSSGKFTGTAGVQGSDVGRISFDCTNCNVTTDWRPLSARTATNQPSGGTIPGYYNISNTPNVVLPVSDNVNYIPKVCEPFMDGYIKLNSKNNTDEVKKNIWRKMKPMISSKVKNSVISLIELNLDKMNGSDVILMVINNIKEMYENEKKMKL